MMKCKTHKRYKTKLRPRSDCIACWKMFLDSDITDYRFVCQEIDRRSPKNYSGISYIDISWELSDENTILQMLKDKKQKIEEK